MFRHFDVLPEGLTSVVSLDPASSDSKKADEFAIAAVGFKGADVYLLDYSSAQAVMPDKASADTFHLALLYRAFRLIVESVAYQRIMAWYLREEMKKRRIFLTVVELKIGKTSNADRIMQTIPGLAAYGHFHCRPTHTAFISQADDYDPKTKDPADDLLTAVANAVIESNPGMRFLLGENADADALPNEDESDIEDVVIGGCP